jgi:hypothetical protein
MDASQFLTIAAFVSGLSQNVIIFAHYMHGYAPCQSLSVQARAAMCERPARRGTGCHLGDSVGEAKGGGNWSRDSPFGWQGEIAALDALAIAGGATGGDRELDRMGRFEGGPRLAPHCKRGIGVLCQEATVS